jgi:hypothetical protein
MKRVLLCASVVLIVLASSSQAFFIGPGRGEGLMGPPIAPGYSPGGPSGDGFISSPGVYFISSPGFHFTSN